MKVITALVILVSLVQVGSALAAPLVVRCLAEKPRGNSYTVKMQIEIALPESLNQFVLVTDPGLENPHVQSRRVGLGSIQITEWGDNAKTNRRFEIGSRRREFVVTALPSESLDTLVGFYLLGQVIYSIRVELGDKEKPFIAFDTFNNEVWKGKCD